MTFTITPDVYQPTYYARFTADQDDYLSTLGTAINDATGYIANSRGVIDQRLERRTDLTFPGSSRVDGDGNIIPEYFAVWIPFEFHGTTDPLFFAGGLQVTLNTTENIRLGTNNELGRVHGGYVMYIFEYRHTVNLEIRN